MIFSNMKFIKLHGILWNSMELQKSSMEFHVTFLGKIKSSMELYGIPWNSGVWKKFYGIPRNFGSGPNSMEFHGTTGVVQMLFKKFHGTLEKVPWNFLIKISFNEHYSCHRNWHTWSSMEFHGIPWNCSCHRNWRTHSSMEFHGTARVIEIGAIQVPWNSMELLVSVPLNSMEPIVCYLMEPLVASIHWVFKWDRIPWNLSFQILMKIILNCAGWIDFRKLINTLYLFAISFTNWFFIINICIIPYSCPALLITYQNIIQNLFSMLIETYFDQKVPWNYLQNF